MAKDIRPDKKLSKRSIVHSAKAKGEAKQPGKEQAGRLNTGRNKRKNSKTASKLISWKVNFVRFFGPSFEI
jgi:hypothetical protein